MRWLNEIAGHRMTELTEDININIYYNKVNSKEIIRTFERNVRKNFEAVEAEGTAWESEH